MKLVVSVFLGMVAINAVMAAAVFTAIKFGWPAGVAVSVVGALATSVVGIWKKRPSLAWAGILALAAGSLGAMDIADYTQLSGRPYAKDILVAEAPSRVDAGTFSFRDGSVRAELYGKATRVAKSRKDYYAAPVVGEGWTDDQPVAVWAVCTDEVYGCRGDWLKPFRAGVRPTAPVPEHFAKAIAAAETDRRLTSAPGAVMIVWVKSVEEAIAASRDGVWFGVQLWNITWVVTLVGTVVFMTWRRRSRNVAS